MRKNYINQMSYKQNLTLKAIGLLLLYITFFNGYGYGQHLLSSRKTSYYTYIYRLTDKQAKKVYKKNLEKVKIDESFFTNLVDTYPTDSTYHKELPVGHYIKTYSLENKQRIEVTSVYDFDIKVLDNKTDLLVKVLDNKGGIVTDAKVKVKMKRLSFDKKTQTYLDKKSNKNELLEVTYNGITAYYNLNRQKRSSAFRRGYETVLYRTPVKYVWLPVSFVISLPIDGVRSIVKGHSTGSIWKVKNFFSRYHLEKMYDKVACLFDKWYCEDDSEPDFDGLLVFSKPMYQPQDTVRFKVMLKDKKGKSISEDSVAVLLYTNNRNKPVELAKIASYRAGGYAYEFALHDSLNLKLDRRYRILLRSLGIQETYYASGYFRYEDYELKKNSFTLSAEKTKHFKGDSLVILASGKDENDLNLMDARMEILVKTEQPSAYFDDKVFVPDTLMFFKQPLEPSGDTEIVIKDDAFPKANFIYNVKVTMWTSDNERKEKSQEANYTYDSRSFNMQLEQDSVMFDLLDNGIPQQDKISVFGKDSFGNETELYTGKAPCQLALTPYFSDYVVKADSNMLQIFKMSDYPSMVQCYATRDSDSVNFVVDNPRNLTFNYHIYQKNAEKERGNGTTLNYTKKTKSDKNYYLSLSYLWAGQMNNELYKVGVTDKKLNIDVQQPSLVYPGQETELVVTVTDWKGKPVENVDLTAFGLTKKFKYTPPTLPDYSKKRKEKTHINSFYEKRKLLAGSSIDLDYEKWKVSDAIDSIAYYQFLYPEDSVYRYEYLANDSLTQIAPFVMNEGQFEPVHVVYIDHKPVYFSWSTIGAPYAFKVDSGYHQVELRTTTRKIKIDSVYVNYGKKLILSVDWKNKSKNISSEEVTSRLSDFEKRTLYPYVFSFRRIYGGNKLAYIKSGEHIQFFQDKSKRFNIANPVTGNVTYSLYNSYDLSFRHEPYFEYDFSPKILKMRNYTRNKKGEYNSLIYPDVFYSNSSYSPSLADQVYTEKRIKEQWQAYLNHKRKVKPIYYHTKKTYEGQGRLLFNLSKGENKEVRPPLNLIIRRHDTADFIRIYNGNERMLHGLDSGYYELTLFYNDSEYNIVDSIYVKGNGLNYYNFIQPNHFEKGDFGKLISQLLEERGALSYKDYYDRQEIDEKIKQQYLSSQTFGHGKVISGVVTDETGIALPGVNVVVMGTNKGTITNFDGLFTLDVPNQYRSLGFSYIGYLIEEVEIKPDDQYLEVTLKEDIQALEELVVIGYGVQKKVSVTGAVSSVHITSPLRGQAAGVSAQGASGAPGASATIQIRGVNSLGGESKPLYVVDGKVFTGDIKNIPKESIEKVEVLKDASATAVYGAMAANGVVLITTKGGFKTLTAKGKGATYDDSFLNMSMQANSLRSNFSDEAFWQPTLRTDKNGKATFNVTFPDDVTNWDTFYLAVSDNKQTGQTSANIKSFKPLMAQVNTPRFLLQNDTAKAIGKVLNYMPDSVKVKTTFSLNGVEKEVLKREVKDAVIDSLLLVGTGDSLSIKYEIQKEDNGYYDGEKREIPVFPLGLEVAKGEFLVFEKDTSFTLSFEQQINEGQDIKLYAQADAIDVLLDEIKHVSRYKYLCNEQLTSKLKAYLYLKKIRAYQDKSFENEKDVKKLIQEILKRRKKNGMWGWWKDSYYESVWITRYVLGALLDAKEAGFDYNLDWDQMTKLLVAKLEEHKEADKVRLLILLQRMGAYFNIQKELESITYKEKKFHDWLLETQLKQLKKWTYNLDTLQSFQEETIFGNVYFSDSTYANLLNNDIQNTLLTYQLIREENPSDKRLPKMRNYFLERRGKGYWRNTYESLSIIETILPDLLKGTKKIIPPALYLSGDINKTITEFPFEMTVDASQKLKVSKEGTAPIYFTYYQKYWNKKPEVRKNDFEITSYFEGNVTALEAGKPIKLIVDIKIKKEAEYLMINIPIPAGCSYESKRKYYGVEDHREYFKNETSIFCSYLRKGSHTFEVNLLPRYSGSYHLNPAKVELMYFPTFYANEGMKKVGIESK